MQLINRRSDTISFLFRATLAATVAFLAGCAALSNQRRVNTASLPDAAASSAIPCSAPIPAAPTYVAPPVTADSAGGYTAAVGSAALDDAMANSKAQSEYQQCLLKR
jgi:hypothetical protein